MNKRHKYSLDNRAPSFNSVPLSLSVGMDIAGSSQIVVRCPHPDFYDSERNVLRRILIVHREPAAADTIALMCATFGWASATASSIEQACDVVQRNSFDLILTDYDLSPDNGLMLICRLRQLGVNVPAIVTTDAASKTKYLQPSILNIAKVLVKPLARATLEKALGECMR
jgi:CheY-like chemotaxis protein